MHQDKKKLQHQHNMNCFEWRKKRALFGTRMTSNIVLGPIGRNCKKEKFDDEEDGESGPIETIPND